VSDIGALKGRNYRGRSARFARRAFVSSESLAVLRACAQRPRQHFSHIRQQLAPSQLRGEARDSLCLPSAVNAVLRGKRVWTIVQFHVCGLNSIPESFSEPAPHLGGRWNMLRGRYINLSGPCSGTEPQLYPAAVGRTQPTLRRRCQLTTASKVFGGSGDLCERLKL